MRHIVEMHGGTVDAASDGEGKGATFRVRLPVMIVHDAVAREPREHPRTEMLAPLKGLRNLAGIRVLAIDDEEDALGSCGWCSKQQARRWSRCLLRRTRCSASPTRSQT